MPDAPETPIDDPLADLERRLRWALPADGPSAMPEELTEAGLRDLLEEARARIDEASPSATKLAVKTRLFGAREPFYRVIMADLPPAIRHLKPFDTNNSGTLERSEVAQHMQESFGKSAWGAWKFAAMLFWIKLGRFNSITISECSLASRHAGTSGNWDEDGNIDPTRFAENHGFLSGHADPFSTNALDELILHNTTPERSPGASGIDRMIGRKVAEREYSLAWRRGGVEREDGVLVLSEPLYRMNVEGTLMAMLFAPRQEAANVFRWCREGCLHC